MLTEESLYIDLVFSLTGQSLPLDNAYIVYSALSRICPAIHELDNISIHPIAGIPESATKQLCLTQRSKLQIRLPVDLIPFIYESLAGQTFSIGQNRRCPIENDSSKCWDLTMLEIVDEQSNGGS
ncbi:hypothetical protein NDI37_17865 [Funiculus sociatus GB2-A5]|uniref:Uncharacterized protein n=1 Tax=Funiculus sociatus GB2-A5 TaxID=2933946 RepID=A0ABV0JS90_9CYAN|nr:MULTISPECIES: type I-MYXAN CRISPR-associated protein Cas6/Cmx6 [unclassified Trichocoleus]MBD1908926.1 hypothetical protein [Trichocoleus sp. FACHB-832]MBD2064575.1 hypothetical protein [Trichocoleus sp. FACHB-6]